MADILLQGTCELSHAIVTNVLTVKSLVKEENY